MQTLLLLNKTPEFQGQGQRRGALKLNYINNQDPGTDIFKAF